MVMLPLPRCKQHRPRAIIDEVSHDIRGVQCRGELCRRRAHDAGGTRSYPSGVAALDEGLGHCVKDRGRRQGARDAIAGAVAAIVT